MSLNDVQQALNARFTYGRDAGGRRGDRWRILKDPSSVCGDCEDYALTLVWLAEERSLWRFWWSLLICRYVVWICTVNGEGHAVLWIRGQGWTDNIQRRVIPTKPEGYHLKIPFWAPLVAVKLVLGFLHRLFGGRK